LGRREFAPAASTDFSAPHHALRARGEGLYLVRVDY